MIPRRISLDMAQKEVNVSQRPHGGYYIWTVTSGKDTESVMTFSVLANSYRSAKNCFDTDIPILASIINLDDFYIQFVSIRKEATGRVLLTQG